MKYLPVFFLLLVLCNCDSPVEIKTKSGAVKGRTLVTKDGEEVNAFLSIPYGAPTSGKNRFGPPKDVEPWKGVLDATAFSSPCYHVTPKEVRDSFWLSQLQESENCLRLNIWVPKHRPKKAAVMVWFHGGGFVGGSSDLPLYDGAILAAREDIIVASVNYRLSSFGFLYLNHPGAPGNVGLMDQAAGLKWIKNNIEAFGGNPDRVTIFGESAGAVSVGYQLLAPTSLDLFRNAILESGAPNAFFASSTREEAMGYALELSGHAGCPGEKDRKEEILRCLQKLSADKLLEYSLKVEDEFLKMAFRPVIDGQFVASHPSDLLSQGRFCGQKNIIIGNTRDEGSNILPVKLPTLEVSEDVVYTEEHMKAAISRGIYHNKPTSPVEEEVIKFLYTDWEAGEDKFSVRHQMVRLFTDRWFGCPALTMADRVVENGNKVFVFRFDHVPESKKRPESLEPQWMGSAHGDEIHFVFGSVLKQEPQASEEEVRLSKQVMRYWANFARNDDPNDEYLPRWPKYDPKDKLRLHLDGKLTTAKKTDRLRECHFWEKTFPNIRDVPKDEL